MNAAHPSATMRRGIQLGALTLVLTFVLALALTAPTANAAVQLEPLSDSILDPQALLFSSSATYGRAINGQSFQIDAILTCGGYQYAAWYERGRRGLDVMLGRRPADSDVWEIMDTGVDMTRTDWDAHNVISMGISSDGVIHLSWDQHCQTMRYMASVAGAADGPTWDESVFTGERSSLNFGGPPLGSFTYPHFIDDPATGNMYLVYRYGCSGGGETMLATYNVATGLWNAPTAIILGRNDAVYTDPIGSSSTRNAYPNGVDVDATGRIHISWTWRESAGGTNHDILYAYSDDGGATWRNTSGGNLGAQIGLNSPGIYIDDGDPGNGIMGLMDRRNTIMNQQTQEVDADGRVHAIMWHVDDAHINGVSSFSTGLSDYFHYYRDPGTGAWSRTTLPNDREVGSRPDVAYDANGNLYVAFVTPGPGDATGYYTDGDLVIVSASKRAGYVDWEVLVTDTRDFIGEPRIDQQRLLDQGVLSVFIQENDDNVSALTGTPLHVLDYAIIPVLAWAGDDESTWTNGGGADWDFDGDGLGDTAFSAGATVRFDDGASTFDIDIAEPVAPGSVTFSNTTQAYAFTGAAITGATDLRLLGGGQVTLANDANSYTGETRIEQGTLVLSGAAQLTATPSIIVAANSTLEVSALSAGALTLSSQTLEIEGAIAGNIVALDGSHLLLGPDAVITGNVTIENGATLEGNGRIVGNLLANSGATIRVLSDGLSGSGVLYEENFLGDGAASLNGQAPDTTANGATWVAHPGIANDGQDISIASGSSATLPLNVVPGVVYTLEAGFRNVTGDSDWFALGFIESTMIGGTSNANRFIADPTTGKVWALFRGDNSGEANQWFVGNASSGTAFGQGWWTLNNNGGDIDIRLVLDTSGGDGAYTAQYYAKQPSDTDYTLIANVPGLWSEDIGAVGFAVSHDDVAGDVAYFRLSVNDPDPTPSSVNVQGVVTLNAGSLLELGVTAGGGFEQISASETIQAGGVLRLVFEGGSADPQPGAAFNLLSAGTISGAFDDFDAEALDAGHLWDLRQLYSQGDAAVVALEGLFLANMACFTGPAATVPSGCASADQDGDGDNDLHDFAIWQACVTNQQQAVFPGGCTLLP